MSSPNVLLIMTDEERYPPPYEDAAMAKFRREHMAARERIRDAGLELHRHYAGSTACVPSRAIGMPVMSGTRGHSRSTAVTRSGR